jgi:putative membrane protein
MRLLFWFFAVLVAAVVALFAVSNRAGVALSLWPLPFLVDAPLYLIARGGALLGFLAGELAAWIAASRRRRELRRQRRHIAALEAELRATHAQLAGPTENAAVRIAARG